MFTGLCRPLSRAGRRAVAVHREAVVQAQRDRRLRERGEGAHQGRQAVEHVEEHATCGPRRHGHAVLDTRRPMTSIFWTTSRPTKPDVSNGTQSGDGGGGAAVRVEPRSQSPSITMRSRGNDGFSSSVAAFSSAATASSMRLAPSSAAR